MLYKARLGGHTLKFVYVCLILLLQVSAAWGYSIAINTEKKCRMLFTRSDEFDLLQTLLKRG